MITGAHVVIYSRDAEADREVLKTVLEFPWVDAGNGWLIFRLPDAEAAVHPSDENGAHELFLMCDDIDSAVETLRSRDVVCGPLETQRWGRVTHIRLPGGGALGLYEPLHARP